MVYRLPSIASAPYLGVRLSSEHRRMDRRTFVYTLGAAVAGPAAVAGAMPRGAQVPARKLDRVGVQLYTLRDAAKIDLDKTLADIAAIGFTEVEMLMSLKIFDHSPTEVRAMLDKHRLKAPSTHVGTETLDNVDAFVDEAKILGHKYLVLADVPASGRQSLATFAAFAD